MLVRLMYHFLPLNLQLDQNPDKFEKKVLGHLFPWATVSGQQVTPYKLQLFYFTGN